MSKSEHFISGLRRRGSTPLAAILRQNLRIHSVTTNAVGAWNACSAASSTSTTTILPRR